ncbi:MULTISPECIES: protealysin inhibitor emfourin [Microbacterium]|uniref:protealysin inhibitor emfourin n=1 Tax=Microbacterium TaxID=33882 RepID=UPI0018E08FAE|nr:MULTISPECIES: protealysin inhibitor emfourin [Microbacterium]
MTHKPEASTEAAARPPAVEVDVARTGGIAGITRRWSAQPPAAEASEWISLIDRCPWDEPPPAEPIADGFVWWIRATWSGADAREAELPDQDVVGAWRELVDAVRDWSRQSPGSERAGR